MNEHPYAKAGANYLQALNMIDTVEPPSQINLRSGKFHNLHRTQPQICSYF